MNNKKLKRSKVTIGLYVCTGIVSVYALYAIFNSISYLRNYFKTYGSTIGQHFGDALSYILNQSLSYIVFAVLLFTVSVVLTEVRKLNPDNYMSAEELALIEAAKAEKGIKTAGAQVEEDSSDAMDSDETAEETEASSDSVESEAEEAEAEAVESAEVHEEAQEADEEDGELSPEIEEAREAIAKKAAEVKAAAKGATEK